MAKHMVLTTNVHPLKWIEDLPLSFLIEPQDGAPVRECEVGPSITPIPHELGLMTDILYGTRTRSYDN